MVEGRTGLPVASFAASTVRFTASPRRVLIVEDDLDSVRILAELVKHIGHDAQHAIKRPCRVKPVSPQALFDVLESSRPS